MKPDDGNEGLYSLCVGTAARGLTSNTPRACPIYGETDAFWELKFASSPQAVAECARERAEEYLARAQAALSALPDADYARLPLSDLLNTARDELGAGIECGASALKAATDESVYEWARATRAFTRSQVRALQVCQALVMADVREEQTSRHAGEPAEAVIT